MQSCDLVALLAGLMPSVKLLVRGLFPQTVFDYNGLIVGMVAWLHLSYSPAQSLFAREVKAFWFSV
jgi:hypothetical protein